MTFFMAGLMLKVIFLSVPKKRPKLELFVETP